MTPAGQFGRKCYWSLEWY